MIPVKHLSSPTFGRLDEQQNAKLQDITSAHIDSFNNFCLEGIDNIAKHLEPHEFALEGDEQNPEGLRISLQIKKIILGSPKLTSKNSYVGNSKIYPAECRQRRANYSGSIDVVLDYSCSNGQSEVFERSVGELPIMVKSAFCNIANLKPAELVRKGEEAEEMGGYFIINGNEKVVRLIIQQRRNYPYCFQRNSWKKRGPEYTEYGVCIRCVREDQTISALTLHYLQSGTVKLAFGLKKEMFFVPIVIILKGLLEVSDKFIYDALIQGRETDSFYKSCIIFMLRQVMNEGLNSQASVLRYVGMTFRVKLDLPSWYSDEEVGRYLFKHSLCIHLDDNKDKFNLLVYMTRKLFAFVNGECTTEEPDNPMFHEVLLPGQLMQMLMKEKLETWLSLCKLNITKYAKRKPGFKGTPAEIKDPMKHVAPITRALQHLISTGNLISNTGLGLMQATGLSVVADKLNFARYVSHFRAVHRGAFFTEMRTTSVRKLLPEAWGFLCPVHTPDGTPCGLLNHMAADCKIVTSEFPLDKLKKVLIELGVSPISSPNMAPLSESYSVLLDGYIVGHVDAWAVDNLVSTLRLLKVKGKGEVPFSLEICLVKKTSVSSQYPGLFLFSTLARMIRPVHNMNANAVEMIGTFEQVYLNVALNEKEAYPGLTTHRELSEHSILSVVANLTPFSDFNQSPRNMYQCQMGKQTMAFPLHSYDYRADNKLYRLQTPQSPLVRPKIYDSYSMDEYPLGTNTVVAVISYTGYDMEDAMIINKSSHERGFTHGCIIKSEIVDLRAVSDDDRKSIFFCRDPSDTSGKLDEDGLPPVGAKLTSGDPYYSYLNVNTGDYRTVKFKGMEDAFVLQIKILGDECGEMHMNHVCFNLRIERNPTIGDKFSSRHGQKGICSMLWPATDMPFTESGMVPDIIFNPHGFPSRMTIGMMIESMAGKSGALHGMFFDATPFTFSEDQPAIDYFGQMLTAGGYNYYGTERLYSGINGQEMEADIYIGLVYYQRLRHMVSDKFQVRTTGPVNQLTQQPLKGRKKSGGVRFGEMERDALITHGSSFLLQDRLFNCSDKSQAFICTTCKSILSPLFVRHADENRALNAKFQHQTVCQHCQKRENIEQISVPFVFRYLVAELASVGIKVSLDVRKNK